MTTMDRSRDALDVLTVDAIRHHENAPLARALDGFFCFTLAL